MNDEYREVMNSLGGGQRPVRQQPDQAREYQLSPEDALDAASRRLCDSSTPEDVELSKKFLGEYRRKQESYVAHLALARSARLSEIFRSFWQGVVPEVFRQERLRSMTNGQIIDLMRATHGIISKEADYQIQVLKNGPHDIEDASARQNQLPKAVGFSEDGPMDQALGQFASLDPKGRERVRSLFDSLLQYGEQVGKNEDGR